MRSEKGSQICLCFFIHSAREFAWFFSTRFIMHNAVVFFPCAIFLVFSQPFPQKFNGSSPASVLSASVWNVDYLIFFTGLPFFWGIWLNTIGCCLWDIFSMGQYYFALCGQSNLRIFNFNSILTIHVYIYFIFKLSSQSVMAVNPGEYIIWILTVCKKS